MMINKNLFEIIALNIVFILVWDFIIFCACRILNESHFDYKKYMYEIKYWEDNGAWYNKRLDIKAWKDILPQYVSKKGFSKKNLNNMSLDYINRFILETCRAEWAHRNCMWVAVLLLFLNKFVTGFIFSLLVLLINFPYICIQRYNRIRLIKVRNKILNRSKGNLKNEKAIYLVKELEVVDS